MSKHKLFGRWQEELGKFVIATFIVIFGESLLERLKNENLTIVSVIIAYIIWK